MRSWPVYSPANSNFFGQPGEDSLFQPSVRSPRWARSSIFFCLIDSMTGIPQITEDGSASDSIRMRADSIRPTRIFFTAAICQGVTAKLDYLRDLGVDFNLDELRSSAIARCKTTGRVLPSKAGYHGYWILDFTEVDPHFGSKDDLQHLITDAKQHGIGTILDVVVNHTADVIQPKNGVHAYQYKFSKPYLDADGKAI